LTTIELQKIGTTNAYNLRRLFERDIQDMAEETQIRTKEAIVALNRNNNENNIYEGDCEFLLSWFREKVHQNNDFN